MKKALKILLIFLTIIFFVLIITISTFLFFYNNNFKEKVYPNVFFFDQNLGGWNRERVTDLVLNKEKDFLKEVELNYEDKNIKTKISDLGFTWNSDETINNLFNYGKNGNYIENILVFIHSFLSKKNIIFVYNFDQERANQYLKELANLVDKDPVDGKFEIKNNKVADFVIGSNGKKLLIEENIRKIKESIINQEQKINLDIEEIKAKNVDDMEKMGIKEIVATGESNFTGSPPNRIHNIQVGAHVFNGILIKPGENFSFITYLGEVSAKTGYLPELVIKEDKTIPEYGGGLCQVSTTFFRAAINAGFPIIERSAHAYRVVYYEPAGFDSTIYQPKPDLIFKNDTVNYILIQTRISGNNLYVDFYGTADGRKVEVSKSTIYNYVQPGDPIIIETTELKPGEKKQTDTAHVGADAYFTRKITYSDGSTKEDRFDSHYIPWRAKFLIGKESDETKNSETDSGEDNSKNNSKISNS